MNPAAYVPEMVLAGMVVALLWVVWGGIEIKNRIWRRKRD